MNKKSLVMILTIIIGLFFVATMLNASAKKEVADTFLMETKGYKKRKKGPPKYKLVEFTHKKHAEDYKISCGECHHDNDNKPLDLKMGDPVQSCAECHNKFVKPKKKKGAKKKPKDMMVHENALHKNCIGCHIDVNKKAGDPKGKKGPAPASCTKCHKKAPK